MQNLFLISLHHICLCICRCGIVACGMSGKLKGVIYETVYCDLFRLCIAAFFLNRKTDDSCYA